MEKRQYIINKDLHRLAIEIYDLVTVVNINNPVELIAVFLLLKKEDRLFFPIYDHPLGKKYVEDIEDDFNQEIIYLQNNYSITLPNSILQNIPKYSRESVIDIVNFLEYQIPLNFDEYGLLLDEIIFYAANSRDKTIIEGVQPREITKLIEKVCESYFIEYIYNPFAGIGSFYTLFSGIICECFSQEINQNTWILGFLRSILYNISPTKYTKDDSIANWSPKSYDLTVTFPPINYHIPTDNLDNKKSLYGEDFVLQQFLKFKHADSIFIGVFTNSFLFREYKHSQNLREQLVNEDLLESIISLPVNILYNTSVSTALLIINPNKKEKGKIKFVDASSLIIQQGKINKLDIEDLLEIIETNDSNFIKYIPLTEIKEKNYILDTKRYFYKEEINIEHYKTKKLKDLITPIKNSEYDQKPITQKKIIRFSNLKNDFIDYSINETNLSDGNVLQGAIKLDKSCLLLSSRFGELKPTYLNRQNKEESIYCGIGIKPFRVKTDIIDIDYLVYILNTKAVKEYVQAYSVGEGVPFISSKDLKEITIPVPSLSQQKKILSAVIKTYQERIIKENDLKKYIKEKQQEYIEELRIKRHTLSQYVSNLEASISALSLFLERNNGILKNDDLISESMNITVGKHIENMLQSAKKVGVLTKNLTNNIEYETAENINLDTFLSKYIQNYPSHEYFRLEYIKDETFFSNNDLIDDKQEKINPIVSISSTELSDVLENIITNAKTHGFSEPHKKYIIRVTLSYEQESNMLLISFENNGNPLPKGMDTKRYITKHEIAGKTGGSGIGGYHSAQIIQHYKGTLSVISNEFSEFPVLICIRLPLIIN